MASVTICVIYSYKDLVAISVSFSKKNLNQSLPFGFIGNSGGILGEIFSESSHATTSPAESEIPIGNRERRILFICLN